jgi:hypothetical protein
MPPSIIRGIAIALSIAVVKYFADRLKDYPSSLFCHKNSEMGQNQMEHFEKGSRDRRIFPTTEE